MVMGASTLHRRPIGLAMMSSKALSALSWLTAAVAALALGIVAYIPARQVAQSYRVNVARAQTVAVQQATSTAISANSTIQATIIAAYPEAIQMNANAQGIPASEAQPIAVEPIEAAQIPVTYAPITILPPRPAAASVGGVVEALGVYRNTETPTPSATAPSATDTPIPFPTHSEAATVAELPVIDISATPTLQPTLTLTPEPEPIPTPSATDAPKATDVPAPTITPVPVVIVTDTPAPTVEPSATATSVLVSPLATPTIKATEVISK